MKRYIVILMVAVGLAGRTEARQSSPGTVTFSNATILNPTVIFDSSGTFVLQISAFDGAKTTTSTVTITVLPAPVIPGKLTVGPGGTVAGTPTTFSVSYASGSVQVAAIQYDLTLPVGVTTNTVTANVVTGAASTAAGKTATGNAISANTYRVIVVGLNQNVIGTGVIAQMNFQLDSALPTGLLAVGISNISASDPNGSSIPMTGVGGTISVSANGSPVVSGGSNQTVTLPAPAILSATAADDGAPNPPGALIYSWTVL